MKMCQKLQEKVSYHCNTIFWYQDTVLILSKIPFLIPLFTCLSFSVWRIITEVGSSNDDDDEEMHQKPRGKSNDDVDEDVAKATSKSKLPL